MEQEKIGIPEFYKQYKKSLIYKGSRYRSKEAKFIEMHRFIIDRQTFSNILKDFNLELARLLLEENLEFRMPSNLGTVRMRKFKRKIHFKEDGTLDTRYLCVDWQATKAFWVREYPGLDAVELKKIKHKTRIFHLNEHTENHVIRLFWKKYGSAIVNKKIYSLLLTRTNKRRVAQLLKTDSNINYYE